MKQVMIGFNHRTTSIQLREQMAFLPHDLPKALGCLLQKPTVKEAYILSTCNRTEIYSQTADPDELLAWLAQYCKLAYHSLLAHVYMHQGTAVFQHMARVACGLDSMALGESQVLGQMKEAYAIAKEAKAIGPKLQCLIDRVLAVSKKIRSQTQLHTKPLSIPYTAVCLLKKLLPDFTTKQILLLGSGRTTQLVATYLQQYGVKQWLTASRRSPSCTLLPQDWSGELTIAMHQLPLWLPTIDVIISACTVNEPLLTKAMMKQVKQPVYIFDLGMPRNVEETVGQLPGVHLYNIDNLQKAMEEIWLSRKQAAEAVEHRIAQVTLSYQKWQRTAAKATTLQALRSTLHVHQQQELAWAKRQIDSGRSAEMVMQRLVHRLANKWLHQPTARLRQAIQEQEDTLLESICELFNLDY